MTIDLSADDLETLKLAIDRAVQACENELVHTEAPGLQHALGRDYRRLVALRDRLVAKAVALASP